MARFVLVDEKGKSLNVEVRAVGTFLNIHVESYGNPVSLDFYDGKLQLLVNADKDEEEPERISLERAKTDDWPPLDHIADGNPGRIIR